MGKPGRPLEDVRVRFARYCRAVRSGCVEWTGYVARDGYGRFSIRRDDGPMNASRAAMILAGHDVTGLMVCHRCDNRRCVNVDHLFVGTGSDNVRDMLTKGRGRPAMGIDLPQARLTPAKVRRIRAMRAAGQTLRGIASTFGVRHQTVALICANETWKHV